MVLNLVSSGSVRTQADWANANLTGLAERVDVSTTEGGNGSLAMASGILASSREFRWYKRYSQYYLLQKIVNSLFLDHT